MAGERGEPGHVMEMVGVSRAFGGFVAVDNVYLSIPEGQKRAVIGPNGAGKSTLINIASGLLAPSAGAIRFRDRDVTALPLHGRTRLGIGRTFQITSVFTKMSVRENVLVSVAAAGGGRFSLTRRSMKVWAAAAERLIADVGLESLADEIAAAVSHGDRKRLEIAMVLALKPTMLLLDEPTAGMGMAERTGLVDLVERVVRERAISLLFVEHDIDVVFRVADQITVMNRGRVFAEGTPSEIAGNAEVQRIYLGARDFSAPKDGKRC